MLSTKKERIFSWILFGGCFIGAALFIILNINRHLNSDMASEMVLAELLLNEKKLLSTNWYYSTELFLVHTHLIFAPLMIVFKDWQLVRIVGTILLYVLLLLSVYYVCVQTQIKRAFPLVGIMFMLPLSQPYFDNVLRGVHYIPYLTGTFILFGLALHYVHVKARLKKIVLLIVGAVLSFAFGIQGMRLILTFAIPSACTVLLLFAQKKFFKGTSPCGYEVRFGVAIGIFCLCMVAGCFLNTTILSKIYDFTSYTNLEFTDIKFPNNVFNDLVKFWGYETGKSFSAVLLHNVVALFFIIAVLFAIIQGIKKDTRFEQRILCMLYPVGCIIFLALYACTTAPNFETYHLPISIFGFPTIVTLINVKWEWKRVYKAIAWIFIFAVVACGAHNYFTNSTFDRNEDIRDLAEYLVDDEYEAGYATFWDGNVLAELSDGRFEMYVIPGNDEPDIDQTFKWMQAKNHDSQPPEGKVFVVIRANKLGVYAISSKLSPADIVYETGDFLVYGYDDYETMKWAMEIAEEENQYS